MRTTQDILFSIAGQSLYLDCTECRPSSVTSVSIFPYDASDDAESEWSASGTIETNPNTTIDADSGYGQPDSRVLNVAATTGLTEDRTYLVTSATGAREWFEVLSVSDATSITARHPLHNSYTTGDTVQSTRITATVDNTWVADTGNLRDDAGPNAAYRVRWVYVVDGTTYVADTYFNLVRYAGAHGVRPQDVDDLAPGWLDRLPTDHRENQGRTLNDNAYREVKFDLHGIWTDDAMVANAELVDELVRYKVIVLGEFAKIMAGGGDAAVYQLTKDAYQQRLDSLLRITNKAPIRDTSGAAQERQAISLTRR